MNSPNPFLSIVVPVYNGEDTLQACLRAIQRSHYQDWELIVVDDGSTDLSIPMALQFRATILQTPTRSGPGAARNLGARVARGKYLCFIDADCEVHPDTLTHLVEILQEQPDLDAVFGSYDDEPKAPNFVAQYKNLFHHYVHQCGQPEASTFWAGCGAIKRQTFNQLKGFDVRRYARPSIEDIELGYRIRQAGGKILLAKQVQVKHHKAWDLLGLIQTDVWRRGVPWTQLLLSNRACLINDLNLQTKHRVSILTTYLLLISLVGSFFASTAIAGVVAIALVLLILNLEVYQFFYQKRGLGFTLGAILMHWLYYLYSGVSFGIGCFLHWRSRQPQETWMSSQPVIKTPVGGRNG